MKKYRNEKAPARRASRRASLRGGIALAALVFTGGAMLRAHAAGILTQGGGSAALAPVTASLTSALASQAQAQAMAVQAQNQLSRVTTALQAMQNLQATARNAALVAPSTVPDGLRSGGLVPDSGLASGGVANPVTDWVNAQTPTQTTTGGLTTVNINQTAAQAILSWNNFNVSRNTTVNFNQQGNTNWVALNKISATGVPSQILGSIQASGQVYLINPNGIIFGGASQINVGSLIASSADISSSQFLNNGIYSTQNGSIYTPAFTHAGGAIIVEPGAVIAANAPAAVTNGGGFVLMMGTQVQNGGVISTPSGQTELAAGDNFLIRPGVVITSNSSVTTSSTNGNEIAVKLNQQGSSLTAGGSGLVVNTGGISAGTGDITLAGETIDQNGVLMSSTSVTYRGTIHLLTSASDPFSSVTLGSNSFTLIEPELDSTATELDGQRAGQISQSAAANAERAQNFNKQFDDLSQLPDQQYESRVEIVSGGTVEFSDGSDTSAPGGQIAVSAVSRVQADSNSFIDVSGSLDVPLAMSSNAIAVNIQSFELRDNPQNRETQDLRNNTVYVDARTLSLVPASSAYATNRDYTAGGLLEVSGNLANVSHTIGEYTALGGTIDLSTGSKGAIVADTSSTFDVAGGSLQYQAGYLPQSYLLASNGSVYNVNTAPTGLTYVGVFGGFTETHSRWGVTQTFSNVLTAPSEIYEAGYTVGRAAGSLTLSSPTTIFNGSLEAGTVNGANQTAADPAGVTDPYTLTQNEVAQPGSLIIATLNGGNLFPAETDVSFAASAPSAGSLTSQISTSLTGTSIFDSGELNNFGLGAIDVVTNGSLDISAPLAVAQGGQLSLFGSSIDIGADLTTPGGSVSAGQLVPGYPTALALPKPPAGSNGTGNTVVDPNVTISTAGTWTNLALNPAFSTSQAFINGGAVTLGSVNNLTLGAGSRIDTSSGGMIAANGAFKGGAGGAISLAAATPGGGITKPKGNLVLGGTLDAIGYTNGGALTLSAPSFLITNAAVESKPAVVALNPAFFGQGFSAYNLISTGAITVAPGTAVNVTEPTYQFTAASGQVPTGEAASAALTVALDPLYSPNKTYTAITQRPGASFSASIISLTTGASALGGPVLSIGNGAAIAVDPGQSINLQATGQITIDGSLQAPGGNITAISDFNTDAKLKGGPGTTSIWLGATAVLNASAQPVTFTNSAGNIVSLAPAGGTITLGTKTSTASIIILNGATVSASGSAATDRIVSAAFNAGMTSALPAGQDIQVDSAGGSISLATEEGIYNDGTLIAAAGGANAAGGSLSMTLDADGVVNAATGNELTPRIFTVTQTDPGALLPANLKPGVTSSALTIGTAHISVQQIEAGGFGSVTLFARDAFAFQGNVTLSTAQSIRLEEGYITDSSTTGSVTLNAPYVLLSGQTPETNPTSSKLLALISGFSSQKATGTFTVNAALLDIGSQVRFGGVLPAPNGKTTSLTGFANIDLNSSGDMRFVPALSTENGALTDLVTTGNLNLTAREIYAMGTSGSAAGTTALIVAGYSPIATKANGGFNPKGVLTISRAPGTTPSAPQMVGGSLTFEAATILQDGVIWQPLGKLAFGNVGPVLEDNLAGGGDAKATISFLPGSITSVSAAGLTIPYGGTTDGVTYNVNGGAVTSGSGATQGLNAVTNGVGTGTITISALTTDLQAGAQLDLQGGGTLTGSGFISGQLGSTDVLTTPLLTIGASGVTQSTLAANPVYAIVVGQQPVAAVAYTATGAVGSTPAVGSSIVIPAGVPGLPAGTYTLLPAQYALTPGGYRVEFDGASNLAAAAVSQLPNGSYAVAGFTALANTNVRASLPSNLTITPAATVLNYGQYDQESYSDFLVATAANFGAVRPVLPIDAGTVAFVLPATSNATIINNGTSLFQAASGGVGGTLQISGAAFSAKPASLDIFGTAPVSGLSSTTVSLSAAQLDAFNASTIELGLAGAGFQAHTTGVTLENGATLTAARVIITALSGGIKLNSGSEIDTLGQGTLLEDSTALGLLSNGGASVLDVGNGYLSYSTAPADATDYGPITVADGAKIYTDGSIAFSTSAAVNIGVNASYGGRYLDLAVPEINIGDPEALGATVPSGLLLTPAVLQSLTQGNASLGVPATQIVVLTASNSLNFYGTTALDLTGANVQLVINTPAIYGFGTASDVATISAGTIVWNGVSTTDPQTNASVSALPGGTVTNGPGSGLGALDFDANTIMFGYSSLDRAQRDIPLNRLSLGFSTVNLNATQEITANNQGSLAVYQSQGTYGNASTATGGTLNLNTPVLTAANAATIGYTAGGAINVGTGTGTSAGATSLAEGGEVDLTGSTINITGAVILPSGKLNLQSASNISLGASSLINLAGVPTSMVNETVYGFGGDLIMESAGGNITQAAGGVINVSAVNNTAGSISATATNAAAGQVSLLGTLQGSSSGGYVSGGINIGAQNLGDFAALNTALNAGGIDQSRSFEIEQGDLTIGTGVIAHNINVSVDNGSLTVAGLLDASGTGGGSISLAASNNLTLAPNAVLDAHGTVLQTDSYGVPIASENAPAVSLTTSTGELTLDPGARINMASADGTARGDLELNVPRLGGTTSGDANISAAGPLSITGAATIAVNAFATYNGLADTGGSVTDPKGTNTGVITQAYLDQINANDTMPYMANAAGNADRAARVAGLSSYGTAFHFRPGVQIVSATPNGDLTVEGDINLAGYRYGAGAGSSYGAGEPGVLLIRAGGNLNVYGSITDGFEQPVSDKGTGFAMGWVVYGGGEPYGQSQTIPVSITIAAGSSLADSGTVNFPVPIGAGTFAAGAVAPVALTVQGAVRVQVAFVATSNITSADGTVLFAQHQIVPAGSIIPNKATIGIGGTLPFAINVGPVKWWPANTPFTDVTSLSSGYTGVVVTHNLTLKAGSIIPADSALSFVSGQDGLTNPTDRNGNPLLFPDGTPVPQMANTRPVTDGGQGQLYGLAQLLPAGDMSWSISLVSGANIAAASPLAVHSASDLSGSGNLTLADTHYGQTVYYATIPPLHNPSNPKNAKICAHDPASCKPTYAVSGVSVVPAFSVVRTGTGSLNLVAGGSINENSSYGVYTAGAQSAAITNAQGKNPYDLNQGWATATSQLGSANTDLTALLAEYQANYPTGGGNVLVAAQGSLNSFIGGGSAAFTPVNSEFVQAGITDTDALGGWLWRQGGAGQPGAWWVEFGALDFANGAGQNGTPDVAQYTGFQGIGTLGGGNLTVTIGGNASQLNLAVASNGRATSGNTLVQNGGGAMSVKISGTLNFLQPGGVVTYRNDGGGVITDLRGNTMISAGSIGNIVPQYSTVAGNDPRFLPPLMSEAATFRNGIDLLPGDGTITLNTRGDLVIDGAGNPGTVQNLTNTTPVDFTKGNSLIQTNTGGTSNFSLWTAATGIDLFSAGGDVAPEESNILGNNQNAGADAFYPANLLVTSQSGNIYIGSTPLELAPSSTGELQLLAANSIIGEGAVIAMSGAALSSVATPFNPAINVVELNGVPAYSNVNSNAVGPLLDFGTDTPTSALHAGDTQPALVYAATGDILDINFGQFTPATTTTSQLVTAAKPFEIYAGRDIVDSGTPASPDTFLNLSPTDITSVTAGRDIIESSFDIAGPGNLVVQAGRNIYLADQGVIDSIGPVFDINPNDRNSGAGISVLAGVGAGPDYAAFANQFLNPASTLSLTDASDIIAANDAALYTWLQQTYGYSGTQSGAYAYFSALASGQQDVFLRSLYFQELNASGLEYNNAASVRYKSYLLGRTAIAALFPSMLAGQPITYTGDITMFGGSGIHTEFGGDIDTLTPGGQTVIGTDGSAPPASAGFITQGSGDINIYALDSVLLGGSRVLTTFGGNIVIWSAQGDVNAGRGSKTTIDYTPLQRVYDNYGDVFLSPTVPSSGAGIATLNPIPSVPAGNIDLVAPLGTIDAGEAGIRGSGNLNIAAAHLANAANIQVQGSSSGVPTASAPNVGSFTSAGNAAGAADQAAEGTTGKNQAAPLPSIWIVEILGYGGEGQPIEPDRKAKHLNKI